MKTAIIKHKKIIILALIVLTAGYFLFSSYRAKSIKNELRSKGFLIYEDYPLWIADKPFLRNIIGKEVIAIENPTKILSFDQHYPLGNINKIKSFGKLRYLFLSGCNIKDLKVLKKLTHLENLDISNNEQITDLNPIADLRKLKYLSLYLTGVKDISMLSNLKELKSISLPEEIQSLDVLKNMPKLEYIYYSHIKGNKTLDLSPLKSLKNLQHINLDFGHMSLQSFDFALLKNSDKLENIDICDAEYENLDQLQHFHYLKKISLRGNAHNRLKDLAFVDKLNHRVTYVNLFNNQIKSLKLLRKKPLVDWLNLSHNKLDSLKGIEMFPNISSLFIDHNPEITDLSPLFKFQWLKYLSIDNKQKIPSEQIEILRAKGVEVKIEKVFEMPTIYVEPSSLHEKKGLWYFGAPRENFE